MLIWLISDKMDEKQNKVLQVQINNFHSIISEEKSDRCVRRMIDESLTRGRLCYSLRFKEEIVMAFHTAFKLILAWLYFPQWYTSFCYLAMSCFKKIQYNRSQGVTLLAQVCTSNSVWFLLAYWRQIWKKMKTPVPSV